MNKKPRQVSLNTTIFASFITFVIGIFLGANWNNLYLQFSPYINPAQKVTSNIKWDDLNEVYSQISSNYDGNLDKTQLIEGAKKGLTAALFITILKRLPSLNLNSKVKLKKPGLELR